MKIENIIDLIVETVLFYYSLIKPLKVTNRLRDGVKSTILQMWADYVGEDIIEEDIDIIGIMEGEYAKTFSIYESNLYLRITHVIISYFDKENAVDPNMEIIEIFCKPYIPGMTITHTQIINIIGFYLN